MGNSQTECQSICGLNFLTSKDLLRTSLHTSQIIRKPRIKSHTAIIPNEADKQRKSNLFALKKGKSAEENMGKELVLKRSNTDFSVLRDRQTLNENDFKTLKLIGEGTFGKICLVKKDNEDQVYSMKIMCKKRLSNRPLSDNSLTDKEVMEKASHPFIINLRLAFENERKIFLVTDYLEGGTLDAMLHQLSRFSEEITRFYTAEVLVALEYLHEHMEVAYNNLKPENILLDSEGHARLTSFGSATKLNQMSLMEDINQTGKIADYWRLGCFIYELLTGKKFSEQNLKEDGRMSASTTLLNDLQWPQNVSKNAKDLITRLLDTKTEKRSGLYSIQEIKKHVFFSGINWERIAQKCVYPPLNPYQLKNQKHEEEDEDEDENETEIEDVVKRCSIELPNKLQLANRLVV